MWVEPLVQTSPTDASSVGYDKIVKIWVKPPCAILDPPVLMV
jgi:hypothetical protein